MKEKNTVKTEKNKRAPINLTLDAAFKLFFKRRPSLLVSLLEDFLPLPKNCAIENVEFMDAELGPYSGNKPPGKNFVLDMKVRLHRKEGEGSAVIETVNVEIQTTAQENFTNRLPAYCARIYSDQIREGDKYDKLLPVYSLAFTTVNLREFAMEDLKEEFYHVCTIRRNKAPDVLLTRGMQFVIVELLKFDKGMKKLLDQRDAWCYLLKRSKDMDAKKSRELLKKGKDMGDALKHLWKLSEDELVREHLEAEEKRRRDHEAAMDFKLKEGLKVGEIKGRKEGMKKGIEIKGMEIALEMLRNELPLEMICRCTGLSVEKIKELKKTMKNS